MRAPGSLQGDTSPVSTQLVGIRFVAGAITRNGPRGSVGAIGRPAISLPSLHMKARTIPIPTRVYKPVTVRPRRTSTIEVSDGRLRGLTCICTSSRNCSAPCTPRAARGIVPMESAMRNRDFRRNNSSSRNKLQFHGFEDRGIVFDAQANLHHDRACQLLPVPSAPRGDPDRRMPWNAIL
jgi:hypothetical protein